MSRIARIAAAHPRAAIATWVAVLLASVPLAAHQGSHLTAGGFEAPGSGSEHTRLVLAREFPEVPTEPLAVLLVRHGPATVASDERVSQAVISAVHHVDGVYISMHSLRAKIQQRPAKHAIVVPVYFQGTLSKTFDTASKLHDQLASVSTGAITASLVGRPAVAASVQALSKRDLASAEMAGLPLVWIVLLAVFGSLAAALLPFAVGIVSVVVAGAAIFVVANITTMSLFVTNVASMIGIGVAVDYSLFVVARFREEREAGASAEAARLTALETSGRAVLFSGITVVVAMATTFAIHSTVLRSIATGAMLVVTVAVLATLTLTPAIITLFGSRIEGEGRAVAAVHRRVRRRPGRTERAQQFWARWVDRVTQRPVMALGLGVAVLIALASPLLSIKLGDDTLRQLPAHDPARVAAETAQSTSGSAPLIVTAALHANARDQGAVVQERLTALARTLRNDRAVRRITDVNWAASGNAALLAVTPGSDPESGQSQQLLHRVRDALVSDRSLQAISDVSVGGSSADQVDLVALISHNLWKVIALLLALTFVALVIMLRSIVLPIKAVLLNLLSVGAAYGVLTAVFQKGWLANELGFVQLGHVQDLALPLVLVVVFGLSMDYELFLLTRIRERYLAHGDNRRAITEGLTSGARVVSGAAAVMVGVFLIFAATGIPIVQQIGLGCAVAIALDATITRLVVLPAAMQLMGRANWWFPGRVKARTPAATGAR